MTYTFKTHCGNFEFTVKKEYLENVPNPNQESFEDLLTKHGIAPFLHNPTGPAILVLKNGHKEYWVDGRKVSLEVEAEIKSKENK